MAFAGRTQEDKKMRQMGMCREDLPGAEEGELLSHGAWEERDDVRGLFEGLKRTDC